MDNRFMATEPQNRSLTQMLHAGAVDGGVQMSELAPLIYDELREIAHRHLGREHERYSLCTTGLVHEAYLKLVDDTAVSSRGRDYFFAAVAHTMRRVIVDHARARNRIKRGGDVHITTLDQKDVAVGDLLDQVVDLDAALSQLEALSPRQVRIVECRVFAGLDVEQTAKALDVSTRTIKRDWAVARAWLLRTLGAGDDA